jgi:hypothetical protein
MRGKGKTILLIRFDYRLKKLKMTIQGGGATFAEDGMLCYFANMDGVVPAAIALLPICFHHTHR